MTPVDDDEHVAGPASETAGDRLRHGQVVLLACTTVGDVGVARDDNDRLGRRVGEVGAAGDDTWRGEAAAREHPGGGNRPIGGDDDEVVVVVLDTEVGDVARETPAVVASSAEALLDGREHPPEGSDVGRRAVIEDPPADAGEVGGIGLA